MLDILLQDMRYGLRTLAKTPTFTIVAVVSLALGIGVNISIFGYLNAALFKPLAVERSGELVSLYHRNEKGADEFFSSSYPEYEFYREHNTVFFGMLAYLRIPMVMGSGATAQQISGELVSPDYFSVLGIHPSAGRFFSGAEHDSVAVISDELWRDRFGRTPGAIGQTIQIGTGKFTVVGVVPGSFRGIVMDWTDPPSLWVPVQQYKEATPVFPLDIVHSWGMESYLVTARLRPGATAEQANAQMAALTARLHEPQGRRQGQRAVVFPVQSARFWPSYRGSIVTFLGALMTIVGVILLIACCNLANLLVARATNRRREIAMRLVLGAGRMRIARQLLIESLLLAAMGGAVAIAVAAWATGRLVQFHRAFRIPLAIDTAWDVRMLAFAIGVSVLTGLLFGAAPVVQTWRTDLTDALKSGAAASGNPRSRLRSILLVGQVALSTVLLCGAGMFVRTLHNARAQDPTLHAENLLLVQLEPTLNGYSETRGQRFYENVLRRVRAIPGVRSAALVALVPFSGRRGGTNIFAPDQSQQQVDFNIVSPDYFQTTGLGLLNGREFTGRDSGDAPAVAVVNETMAERFWPGENPLGKQLRTVRPPRTLTVVGMVRDGKFRGYRDELRPGFYVPGSQQYRGAMTLEARTAGNAAAFGAIVRREIAAVDGSMPLTSVLTMEARLDDVLSQERLIASFASGLGLVALTLAAIGIYGVLSFAVARRTREIGIRMALGARPSEISRMVLRESAALAACGFATGGAGAVMLARMAKALLYGVAPTDPAAFGLALGMLTSVALISALIPAWRAARLDPATTLRSE
uniref:Permease n=1 Tax=Solibacter usitatus (strain Ellin6076) TaxID=234267 RepID=Q02A83_SOLUE